MVQKHFFCCYKSGVIYISSGGIMALNVWVLESCLWLLWVCFVPVLYVEDRQILWRYPNGYSKYCYSCSCVLIVERIEILMVWHLNCKLLRSGNSWSGCNWSCKQNEKKTILDISDQSSSLIILPLFHCLLTITL